MGYTLPTDVDDETLRKLVKDEYRRFLKVPEVRVVLEKIAMKRGITTEAALKILLDEMAHEATDIKSKNSHLTII